MRMRKLLFILFLLVAISCDDDFYRSRTKLEVYVTQNGEVPDAYKLNIYRGDKLIKTDEFDRKYRGTNNLTEVLDPIPGPYYLEARSGSLQTKDSTAVHDFGRVKTINVDLAK